VDDANHGGTGECPFSGARAVGVRDAGVRPVGQSFLGQWTATVHPLTGGDVSETVTVVKTGDKFSYKRKVTTPDGALVISYTGLVSGNTFTGTVDLGGFAQAPWTGERIQQHPPER
jgi:hypothetical protein